MQRYPWHDAVLEIVREPGDRRIDVVLFDQVGDSGKSTFSEYLEDEKLAVIVPPFRLMADIMAFVMDCPAQPAYLVDMPRGLKKEKLRECYSGLESLNNGYAYDKRRGGKRRRLDRPRIVVFTEEVPAFELLGSRDRWVVWEVTSGKDLVPLRYPNA
jgi:hypothetical protein